MTMPEQKKAVVPRLRFPEFRDAGPWEVKRLGEICAIKNGSSNAQDHTENGIYPLFDRSEVIKKSNRYLYDCEAVIIPGEGATFTPRYYRGKFDLHQRAYALMGFRANARFVGYQIEAFKNLLVSQAVSSTVLSLRMPILERFTVLLPTGAEQQKIADCLSLLDELIELEAKQLEALQAHKKGLMQQLFPREGETTPRLRFPEFRDAGPWEVKRLETIVELAYGAALPESHRNKGDVPVVGSNGIVGYHDKPLTKGPTIVIGRKGSAGEVTWVEEACFPIDTTFFVQFRRSLDSPRFLYFLLLTLNLPELARAEGVPGLNRNDVYSRRVGVPSATEQQKIADCLSSLDELIELQAKQLEALKAHKKGLMQQLFPREGETTPRLRFPEFRDAGPWEVKRLGEIAEITMGASPPSAAYNDKCEGLPLLQGNADIRDNRSAPRVHTRIVTKVCWPGDILFSVRAPVGQVAKSQHHACIGRGLCALRTIGQSVHQEFLYQWFLAYAQRWERLSQGGTFDAINSDDLNKSEIRAPSLTEQQKIADCLSSLDELIELQAKQLEALKAHKKGLMQQLFPQEIDL